MSAGLGLHDAELYAVSVDRIAATARLDFRDASGLPRSMALHGLKALRCEDLAMQSVVSRLLRSSTGEIRGEGLTYWLSWATSRSDSDSWLSEQRRHEWSSACEKGRLELLVFEPSAGAQIAAVCDYVTTE
jgi:hypothetical protein